MVIAVCACHGLVSCLSSAFFEMRVTMLQKLANHAWLHMPALTALQASAWQCGYPNSLTGAAQDILVALCRRNPLCLGALQT